MRSGFVFILLFVLLIGVYALVSDTLGNALTFALQAAIIAVVLSAALWFRQVRARHGWSLFQDAELPTNEVDGDAGDEHEPHQVRKAS